MSGTLRGLTRHTKCAARSLAAALLLLGPAPALGSGFATGEQGARATAMAGALTALAHGPAALFYNPAGLVQLEGLQLELGLTLAAPGATYRGEVPGLGGLEAEVQTARGQLWLPNLYASYRLADRLALGFGLYMPYNHTVEWPRQVQVQGAATDWWGRAVVQQASLTTLYLTPTLALKLHRRVSLGLGFSAVLAALDLRRAVTRSASADDDVDLRLTAEGRAFSATAGLLVQLLPGTLDLGLTYRGGANLRLQGDARYTAGGTADGVPAGLRATLQDGPVETELALPHVVSLGTGVRPMPGLTVGLTLEITTWSTVRELTLRHTDNPQQSSTEPKSWANTFAVRLGGEYALLGGALPLRLGLAFDQGPGPQQTLGPELPAADTYVLALGVGYRFWRLSVDLAYQYAFTARARTTATAPLPGTYSSDAHLVGLSIGFTTPVGSP